MMTKSVLSTICLALFLLSITCQTAPNNTAINSKATTDANGTAISSNNGSSTTNLPNNTTVSSAGAQTNTSNPAVGNSSGTTSQTNASNAAGTNTTTTGQTNSSNAAGPTSTTNTQFNNTNLNGSTTATNTTTTNNQLPNNVTNSTTTTNSVTAPAGAAARPNASTEVLPGPVLPPAPANATNYPTSDFALFLIEPQFLSNDVNNQVLAYLYCANNSATYVIMCTIYDGRNPTAARFLGIEYIINATAFESLSAAEQRFWHSHAYGVQSGNIQIPNLNGQQLTDTLTVLAASFGKSVFLWNNLFGLPTGDPTPAFSFTNAGQLNANVGTIYDNQTLTNITQRTANNANATIPTLPIAADSWEFTGQIPVFNDTNVPLPANLWGLNFAPPQQQ